MFPRQASLGPPGSNSSANRAEPQVPASRACFDISDIRELILVHLDRGSLAIFMRWQRRTMRDVSELLYHSISGKRAQYGLTSRSSRSQLYREGVRHIDARSIMAPAVRMARHAYDRPLLRRLEAESSVDDQGDWSSDSHGSSDEADDETDSDSETERRLWSKTCQCPRSRPFKYDPSAANLVLPDIVRRFPHVKDATFGGVYEPFGNDDIWTVQFNNNNTSGSSHAGHVDLFHTRRFDVSADPATATLPFPPPSPAYTIWERFDLIVHFPRWREDPLRPTEWLEALRNSPIMGQLYKSVSLGRFPVDLSYLSGLYLLQDKQHFSERLEHIISPYTTIGTLRDFADFASIASTSLVSLVLCGERSYRYPPGGTNMSFSDLPQLVDTIKTKLPSLRLLRMALEGVGSADRDCAAMLSPEKLEPGGTLTELVILTSEQYTALWSVLRCLAPLWSRIPDATVHIAMGDYGGWTAEAQAVYLRYLQSQSPERRAHLATVNFPSLGLFDPIQVADLAYDADGRPMRRQ